MKQTRIMDWVFAAALFCGTSMFIACSSDNNDNPAIDDPAKLIAGTWYGETERTGTINFGHGDITYVRIIDWAWVSDSIVDEWIRFFIGADGEVITDQDSEHVILDGKDCGDTFNGAYRCGVDFTVSGQTVNVETGIPYLENNTMMPQSWTMQYKDGTLIGQDCVGTYTMQHITPQQYPQLEHWFRVLKLDYGRQPFPRSGDIDFEVLVNKTNRLPDNWENELLTEQITNSLGDDVKVEISAYYAYLRLKSALRAENVEIDIDSSLRTVAEQQDIWDRFMETYGEEYTRTYVAVPGYSEHHTGLAIDLYLRINDKDVYLNEDMVQYPEIWAKIHARLGDFGFILRYPKGKEGITGYGYEPWHIRYINDEYTAKDIQERGITLEEYIEEWGEDE